MWRTVALLSIHPLAIFGLAVANPGDLFYATVVPDPSIPSGVHVEFGLAFWVHTLYSYVLILVGTAFIVGMLYRSRTLFYGQVVALLATLLAPTVGNVVSLARLVPLDATPVGFVVANALFTVAIVRYQLVDLTPVAHDRVLDEISDAVFVVDVEGRLIDVNRTGERLAEYVIGTADIVGESVDELLTPVPAAREGGFYVEDNGVGISEELRERVFESGYSGGDGTGFGLPIVEQIAEAPGWRVSVTEGAEGGARFEFDGVRRPDGR